MDITAVFQTTWTRNEKYKKLLDGTLCTKKTWSMQKTKVTGKAATLLVRSIKPSSSSLNPTIKRLVIFFLLLILVILSSGFFKLFGMDENHAEMLFSSQDFFKKRN